jgi:hypothetical protein
VNPRASSWRMWLRAFLPLSMRLAQAFGLAAALDDAPVALAKEGVGLGGRGGGRGEAPLG